MVSSEIGKRALGIMLLTISILLSVFVFSRSFSAYDASRDYVGEKSRPTINCLGYAYVIQNIAYSDGKLSFDIKHATYSDVDNISSLTVIADKAKKAEFQPMLRGVSRHIVVEDVQVGSNFSLYPDGCSPYPVVCDMAEQRCR